MKDKPLNIIGLDKGTRERTITDIVVGILDFLVVFNIVSFTDAQVQAIVKLVLSITTFIAFCVSYYYNNCHTEANCKYTGLARAENKGMSNDLYESEQAPEEVIEND